MKNKKRRRPNPFTFRTALCGMIRDPAMVAERALEEGWRARPESSALSLTTPINWTADPDSDRNWRFQLHAWRPLDVFVVAHDVTGDPQWLDHAVRLMLDWARAEKRFGVAESELFWNDMGAGLRACKLAYVLSRLKAPENLEASLQIRQLADLHMEKLRDPDFFGLSNHGFFQVHGLMSLAMLERKTERGAAARERAIAMLRQLMALQFSPDGGHLEHSPGYHAFALNIVRRIFASGWYKGLQDVQGLAADAQSALPWFIFPDGLTSAIGDSERGRVRARPPKVASSGPQTRIFRQTGYAVVRSPWSAPLQEAYMLLVAGGHHSHVHKHADDLSFELFDKGRFWIVDTGKYSYSKLDWRQFTDSARAHNAVDLLQERENNGIKSAAPVGGMLTDLRQDGDTWVIEGAFERPEFGVSHARTMRYKPGLSLTLIDHIRADRPRTFTGWLHLAPDLKARRSWKGWRFPGGRIRYACEGGGRARLTRAWGQTHPELQGWVAEGYHQITPADALGVTVAGTDVVLTTEILLDP